VKYGVLTQCQEKVENSIGQVGSEEQDQVEDLAEHA
jgi:hypothetical protein